MPESRRAAVSQAEYARLRGVDKSQITRLKQAGRLVMAGKQVLVAESDALLDATSSPLPHHLAATDARAANRPAATASQDDAGDEIDTLSLGSIGLNLKFHQARKMKAEAEVAMMERDEKAGALLDAGDVRRHIANMGQVLRATLEGFPDRYAGVLAAENDQERVHGLLVEAIEQALTNAADDLAKKGLVE